MARTRANDPQPFPVSPSLAAAMDTIAGRVERLCPHCKKETKATPVMGGNAANWFACGVCGWTYNVGSELTDVRDSVRFTRGGADDEE